MDRERLQWSFYRSEVMTQLVNIVGDDTQHIAKWKALEAIWRQDKRFGCNLYQDQQLLGHPAYHFAVTRLISSFIVLRQATNKLFERYEYWSVRCMFSCQPFMQTVLITLNNRVRSHQRAVLESSIISGSSKILKSLVEQRRSNLDKTFHSL